MKVADASITFCGAISVHGRRTESHIPMPHVLHITNMQSVKKYLVTKSEGVYSELADIRPRVAQCEALEAGTSERQSPLLYFILAVHESLT
jgi:hypothetical protein